MNSRHLLVSILLSTIILGCSKHEETRPNVLLIFTDQQHINMMSAAGNPHLQTPNMDALASRGVRFTNSYTTSPVCAPARSSILTGRMPHETGVEWNGQSIKDGIPNMGEIFRAEGYNTIWAGKWHLPDSYPQRTATKNKEIPGFEVLPFWDADNDIWILGSETDVPLTNSVVNFLNSERSKENPFLLAVSYHNPHDICFYPRKAGWFSDADSTLEIRYFDFEYALPEVVGTHPSQIEDLMNLPANHMTDSLEPSFLTDKRLHHDHEYGVETWFANNEFDSLMWRGYLNAYNRLVEEVDVEIGRLMTALEANGLDENTMIIFTSDHGDGAAAHKWAAKLSLYEESSAVPMLVSYPGGIPEGLVDSTHLVSLIDIVPTFSDYAGISNPPSFTGKSLRPIIDQPEANWRDYLVVELADYRKDKNRKGRLIRSNQYKYNVYSVGERPEQLFDLSLDPGEMNNLAFDSAYSSVRRDHLVMLKDYIIKTNDNNFKWGLEE